MTRRQTTLFRSQRTWDHHPYAVVTGRPVSMFANLFNGFQVVILVAPTASDSADGQAHSASSHSSPRSLELPVHDLLYRVTSLLT